MQRESRRLITEGYIGEDLNDELANVLGISRKKLDSLLTLQRRSASFEEGTTEDGIPISKTVAAEQVGMPDVFANKALACAMCKLTDRERMVLHLTLIKERTLEDVGTNVLGVTRERTRQIQEKALKKLREALTKIPEFAQRLADAEAVNAVE